MLIPADENHFTVNVDVHVSKQFFGWVFSLGEQVKIELSQYVGIERKNYYDDRGRRFRTGQKRDIWGYKGDSVCGHEK